MGVTVYINGYWYSFEHVEDLVDLLDEHCDDAGYESGKNLCIEYDN